MTEVNEIRSYGMIIGYLLSKKLKWVGKKCTKALEGAESLPGIQENLKDCWSSIICCILFRMPSDNVKVLKAWSQINRNAALNIFPASTQESKSDY